MAFFQSDHTIPKNGTEFTIQPPLCLGNKNSNLLLRRSNGQISSFNLQSNEETIIKCESKWRVIKVIDLTDDFFLQLNLVETIPQALSIEIQIIGKTFEFSQKITLRELKPRLDQTKYLRVEAMEQSSERTYYTHQVTILVLEKLEEQSVNNQNMFCLHIMKANFVGTEASLTFIRKVEFSATLKCFEIVPLWDAGSLLYSAQHTITGTFQFLFWDSKKIHVLSTQQALKGTVVHIMPFREKKQAKEVTHVLVFYNTNGSDYPNLMKYDLNTKQELHKSIQIQDKKFMTDYVLPQLQDEQYCFIHVTNMTVSNLIIYDIFQNLVTCVIPSLDSGACFLGHNIFVMYSLPLGPEDAQIKLYNRKPMLLSLHYFLQNNTSQMNQQYIVEEIFQLFKE